MAVGGNIVETIKGKAYIHAQVAPRVHTTKMLAETIYNGAIMYVMEKMEACNMPTYQRQVLGFVVVVVVAEAIAVEADFCFDRLLFIPNKVWWSSPPVGDLQLVHYGSDFWTLHHGQHKMVMFFDLNFQILNISPKS